MSAPASAALSLTSIRSPANPSSPIRSPARAPRPASSPLGLLLGLLLAVDPPLLPHGPHLEFDHRDRVGGGTRCKMLGCVRSQLKRQLCQLHHDRWTRAGAPPLDTWIDNKPAGVDRLSLARLPEQLRLEVAYGIRCAGTDSSHLALSLRSMVKTVGQLRASGVGSLLDINEGAWVTRAGNVGRLADSLLLFSIDRLEELLGRGTRDHELARDSWRLRRLGIPGITGSGKGMLFHFTPITQLWLRAAVKRFLRWRLDTGHSPSGMHRDLITLTRLGRALSDVAGEQATVDQFTRAVIDRLLGLLIEEKLVANGRSMALTSVRMFMVMARQHDWLPGLDPRVAIYPDDMPRRTPLPPRALPEFVMVQLEKPDNLSRIAEDRYRLLIPLLMQTGLRQKDARLLPPDCVVTDTRNAPYLRYFNHKMNREALVPITPQLAEALAERRAAVLDQHPGTTFLFARVDPHRGRSTATPPGTTAVGVALAHWLSDCDVRDEHGRPVHVTPHQFRHTLGTRLINNDVPQDVVRQLLDHSSPEMTAHYARLHDTTVREHWERARKVNIDGQDVAVGEDSPLADAAWMNHHLSRATMALPNGYCGLPLQQSCPHANACLTCPVFITTPEFLDQHRQQLAHTEQVLAGARANNQLRLVESNQRVADNLTNIITALESNTPMRVDHAG